VSGLADAQKQELGGWVQAHGFQGYFGSSLKGDAQVDWDDGQSRQAFLQGIVVDAKRLMTLAQEVQATLADGAPERQQLAESGQLLGQLIDQDVDLTGRQAKLKEGVSPDRVVSVHDPRCATGARAVPNALTGTKPQLQWMSKVS